MDSPPQLSSCIYYGTLTHQRNSPKRHRLQVSVYMLYMELVEQPSMLLKDFWGWSSDDAARSLRLPLPIVGRFSPRDYLSKDKVKSFLSVPGISRVFVLCNGRCFGFIFNPICIYFAFDSAGRLVGAISQVHNTPWGEQILYKHDFSQQLRTDAQGEFVDRWKKEMHVSPFFDMNYHYLLRVRPPSERLRVTISLEDEHLNKPFSATLELKAAPLSNWTLSWLLLRYPFMTFVVMIAIYWHALLLWFKGVAYVPHPKHAAAIKESKS